MGVEMVEEGKEEEEMVEGVKEEERRTGRRTRGRRRRGSRWWRRIGGGEGGVPALSLQSMVACMLCVFSRLPARQCSLPAHIGRTSNAATAATAIFATSRTPPTHTRGPSQAMHQCNVLLALCGPAHDPPLHP